MQYSLERETGIPEIERLASAQEEVIQQHDLKDIQGLPYNFIPEEQKVELLARVMVRPLFREALVDSVEASLLSKLENVMFSTSYPTPPMAPPDFGPILEADTPQAGSRQCTVL